MKAARDGRTGAVGAFCPNLATYLPSPPLSKGARCSLPGTEHNISLGVLRDGEVQSAKPCRAWLLAAAGVDLAPSHVHGRRVLGWSRGMVLGRSAVSLRAYFSLGSGWLVKAWGVG